MPDITYVTVPEYQPSSASITVGDPFYKTSGRTENITVRRAGFDVNTVALIGIPIGVVAVWLLVKKKRKKKGKRKFR